MPSGVAQAHGGKSDADYYDSFGSGRDGRKSLNDPAPPDIRVPDKLPDPVEPPPSSPIPQDKKRRVVTFDARLTDPVRNSTVNNSRPERSPSQVRDTQKTKVEEKARCHPRPKDNTPKGGGGSGKPRWRGQWC